MNRDDINMKESCEEIVAGLKTAGKEWVPTYRELFKQAWRDEDEADLDEDGRDEAGNDTRWFPHHNRPADTFGPEYHFLQDSQDYKAAAESVGVPAKYIKDITGAFAKIGEGDYDDIWFSESSRPYDKSALYHPLSYFKSASAKKGSTYSHMGYDITIERNPRDGGVGHYMPWLWSVLYGGYLLHGSADTEEGAIEGAKRAIDAKGVRASVKKSDIRSQHNDDRQTLFPGAVGMMRDYDEVTVPVRRDGTVDDVIDRIKDLIEESNEGHLPEKYIYATMFDDYGFPRDMVRSALDSGHFVSHPVGTSVRYTVASVKTALIPEDSPKGEGVPGAPGSTKSDNDKSMEDEAPTEEEPGDKDLGEGWTDPTGGGMGGGGGMSGGSADEMSGEAQKRVSAPPEILRKFTPMDLQQFQGLEKQLLTALQTHNTTYMLQVEKQMQDLVNKYVLGAPADPLSGKGFIARMMKGHLALRRSMIPLLKKASTAIYAVMQNFPVIVKNVSLGSVRSGDYSANPDEGAVEWIVSLRRIGMPLYSKVGILKVVVNGDNTYLKPTIWDISGNAFNLDSDGMDLFFGMRFQEDIENIEEAYMRDEKNARLKKSMPSTPLTMGRKPNTAPTSGFGGGDQGVY